MRRLLRSLLLSRLRLPRDAARFAFKRHARKEAVRTEGGERVTFAELGQRVFSLAAGLLARDLAPGDRVAFTLPNSPEFIELRLACHEVGLVAVPLAWDLSPEARRRALALAAPSLYVFDPALDPQGRCDDAECIALPEGDRSGLDRLAHPGAGPSRTRIDPASPATINFTSGTTGEPKGVVSTHGAWVNSLRMTIRASLLPPRGREVFLHAIPFATAGWGAVLPCLLGGVTGVTMRAWNPAHALGLVERHGVTRTFLTPSQLIDWLDEPDLEKRAATLRAIIWGTAPLHGPKMAEAIRRLGPILQGGYGLAEVLPPVALLAPDEHDPTHPYRVGRVARGVEMRIVGEDRRAGARGLVEIRSPTQTPGYWKRKELTRRVVTFDDFFHTGDEGFLDADGFLNVIGRASERVAGLAAHPREIEEAVHSHPDVKECVLVAGGDAMALVFSVRRGHVLDAGELAAFLEARDARLPAGVECIRAAGNLTRSAAGKVRRKEAFSVEAPAILR